MKKAYLLALILMTMVGINVSVCFAHIGEEASVVSSQMVNHIQFFAGQTPLLNKEARINDDAVIEIARGRNFGRGRNFLRGRKRFVRSRKTFRPGTKKINKAKQTRISRSSGRDIRARRTIPPARIKPKHIRRKEFINQRRTFGKRGASTARPGR